MEIESALAHSAVTSANEHDKHALPDLLHGREERVNGDNAYASQYKLIESKAPGPRTERTSEFARAAPPSTSTAS